MEFNEKNYSLKNKETITIRAGVIEDASELIQTIRSYIQDSPHIPLTLDEFNPTIKEEEKWIQSFIDNENSLLLVALKDKKIIGNIDLTGSLRSVMSHTAVIGIGILNEWRNVGLGTILLDSVISWAKQNPNLELLRLNVYSENKSAIALYKKYGFVENGVINNYFKKDGEYFNNLTMSLNVKS